MKLKLAVVCSLLSTLLELTDGLSHVH